jgi:site-specific recombinase XerD
MMSADKEIRTLQQHIHSYLGWIDSLSLRNGRVKRRYTEVLSDFVRFVQNKEMASSDDRALDIPTYLNDGETNQHLKSKKEDISLPEIYEQYFLHQKQTTRTSRNYTRQARKLLILFHEHLEKHKITLSNLDIGHVDQFMAEFKVSQSTRNIYRYYIRGFLKYLYHEQRILKKDLAPLLVGPRQAARRKPPKFLRPEEVRKLFYALQLKTPADIRTYAIVHLAYFLGIRPVEISRLTFDDISFSKGELTLRKRKADNPITLPVPKQVLKAIAVYVAKSRPKSPERHIFLSFHFPYRPMKASSVVGCLFRIMKKAGLPASGYWLRHTYAQNLLQMGRSIYEIKEMMGHDNIESTGVYLHVHTELMRKGLFNETL